MAELPMLSRTQRKAQNRLAAQRAEPDIGWNAYLRLAQCRGDGELKRRYRLYMRSPEWRAKRRWFLKIAGHQCALCGTAERLEVHHTHYLNVGQEPLQDLRVVCRGCHLTAHAGKCTSHIPMTPRQQDALRAERMERMAREEASAALRPVRRAGAATC
jgi:hypothetical protein